MFVSRRGLVLLGAGLMLLGPLACVDIDGGAVEVAWVLRTPQGRAISTCDCTDPPIKWVRLQLEGVGDNVMAPDPCAGRDDCQFSCPRSTGATPLNIPPGSYAMALQALDAMGQPITRADGMRTTPEAQRRVVEWGQSVDLGAIQVIATCAGRCQANISQDCTDQ